jgi:hypothetical protein
VLALGVAAASLLGPLGFDLMHYRTSETTLNQLLGSDAAALFVVAPLTLAAAVLVARRHPVGPLLALGVGVYALYTCTQIIIGQDTVGDYGYALPAPRLPSWLRSLLPDQCLGHRRGPSDGSDRGCLRLTPTCRGCGKRSFSGWLLITMMILAIVTRFGSARAFRWRPGHLVSFGLPHPISRGTLRRGQAGRAPKVAARMISWTILW